MTGAQRWAHFAYPARTSARTGQPSAPSSDQVPVCCGLVALRLRSGRAADAMLLRSGIEALQIQEQVVAVVTRTASWLSFIPGTSGYAFRLGRALVFDDGPLIVRVQQENRHQCSSQETRLKAL